MFNPPYKTKLQTLFFAINFAVDLFFHFSWIYIFTTSQTNKLTKKILQNQIYNTPYKSSIIKFISFFIIIFLLFNKSSYAQSKKTNNYQITESEFESEFENNKNIDPYEKINRKIYAFNDFLDRNFLQYVARGYRKFVPKFSRKAIRNFSTNLSLPLSAINSLAQGKIDNTLSTMSTFLINSTVGIGGIIDVASSKSIKYNYEDFAQTFGFYGLKGETYLYLPIFGPKTVSDFVGFTVDKLVDPLSINTFNFGGSALNNNDYIISYNFVDIVDKRESLLNITDAIKENSFDPYATIRSAYLQKRKIDISR